MKAWMRHKKMAWGLLPFAGLYGLIAGGRRFLYQKNILFSKKFSIPVIVVGNITAGGTGKTPTIIALCLWLQQQGYHPGVVSRGYKGQTKSYPSLVTLHMDPKQCGDEPWLIHQKTRCPVVVDPNRVRAVEYLLEKQTCDVILSDDGLQHYALQRTMEVALVNQDIGFGNGWLLPAGPLREPLSRLNSVDFILYKSKDKTLKSRLDCQIEGFLKIRSQALQEITSGTIKKIHAVAGIAYPQSFFEDLRVLGFEVLEHAFPDHHKFTADDFKSFKNYPIIMTEKDAIKCYAFAKEDWYVAVQKTQLPDSFLTQLRQRLLKDAL